MITDTYHTILQVAQELFTRHGYTATSMRAIAEAAGIGKATIYHHFRDKETILMTLVEANVTTMQASLDLIQVEADPLQRIRVTAQVSLRYLYDAADLLQIARREVPNVRQHLLDNFLIYLTRYRALLEEAFLAGTEAGLFRPFNPQETSLVFMNMIQGNFALYYLTGMRAETPEKAAARLLDVFFNGILARPDSPAGQPAE